jgi:hypothetical protein
MLRYLEITISWNYFILIFIIFLYFLSFDIIIFVIFLDSRESKDRESKDRDKRHVDNDITFLLPFTITISINIYYHISA